MAKNTTNTRVTGVKTSTLATYEGVFAGVIGLGIAILYSLQTTVDIAQSTQSVLSGLAFGLATGAIAIFVLPLIYFGIGYIFGAMHGFVFNVIAETSGGLVFRTSEDTSREK